MDFKKDKIRDFFLEIITALILVFRHFLFLMIFPYKTLRKISLEKDFFQTAIIFLLIFIYFKLAYFLKDKPYSATFTFFIFCINFFLTTLFFYFLAVYCFKRKEASFLSLLPTFAYTLFPTLIWFSIVSFLYIILPPPRKLSFLGISFSIFFLSFSLTLFLWKIILTFLALRFSLRLSFFQIVYAFIFYAVWFIPYSIFLYQLRIFRLPFI